MIGRLREPLEDLRRAPRVDGRARDDLLKQRRVDVARARERREHAARPDERQPEHVDVLVAAAAGGDLIGRVDELRRIEHDEVEARARLSRIDAQLVEHVGDDESAAVADAVRRRLALRERERLGRGVDQRRALRAGAQARDRESAGVRESVEHVGVARVRGDALAVALLVEIGAGLLAVRDVDDEPHAAGNDLELARRLVACQRRRAATAEPSLCRAPPSDRS